MFCPTIKNMTAKPVTCKWCKQSIPSKTQYEAHAKTCRPFACGQCDEKFKSQTALREHTKKTHQQLIQCPLCDIAPFKSDAQLEEHCFRDHDMPIQCKFCDKTFTTPHKRRPHEDEALRLLILQVPMWVCISRPTQIGDPSRGLRAFKEGCHCGHKAQVC